MTTKEQIKDYRPKLTTETRDSLFDLADSLGFVIARHGTYHGEPSVRDLLTALAATYNRPGHVLFDHNVFALCSDGDMMEGISAEAASLAGHLQLANLCWIYDCNRITIEGATGLTFTEDVGARFETYGWRVLQVADANAIEQLSAHLQTFALQPSLPTLIVVQSHIGYGAPHKQDAKEAHGEALGEDEVRLTKEFYGWDPDAKFLVPSEVPQHFQAHFGERGKKAHAAWNALYEKYQAQYPDLAQQIDLSLIHI